jgi:hypothetical protein
MKGEAKVRMICIMAGSVLAAVLVPLAVRARVAAPRPVEAPPLAYSRWEGRVMISDNAPTEGMWPYPALAARGEYVYAMWSKQGSGGAADYDPNYNWSDSYGSPLDGWDNTDVNIQDNALDTPNVDLAVDSANDLHFVWSEATGTPSYTLYYSYTQAASIQTIVTTNKSGMVPAIAVGSSTVYVVWSEGLTDIKYSSKPIGSGSWSPTTVRSSPLVRVGDPAIAVGGSTVHVAWSEGGLDDAEILYKKCCPWSSNPITVSHDVALASFSPALAVSGSDVYAVWCEYDAPGTQYIRFEQSGDGGSTWGGSQRISGDALAANATSPTFLRPDITVDISGTLHVVFNGSPGGTGGFENIYYVSNSGSGWSARKDVSEKAQSIGALAADANSTTPAIAVSGDTIHVIWAEQCEVLMQGCTSGEYEVFHRRRVSLELGEGVYLPLILKAW